MIRWRKRKVTNKELQKTISEIKADMHFFDYIIHYDYDEQIDGTYDDKCKHYLNNSQLKAVRRTFRLLRDLDWQLALNNTKETVVDEENKVIRKTSESGVPVKIRPCGKEYGDKTYFGILIGDVALGISESVKKENPGILHIKRSFYNPAIFVPELNEVIYGCGSWWCEIESEEELNKLITDELINDIWYVKMLNSINDAKS